MKNQGMASLVISLGLWALAIVGCDSAGAGKAPAAEGLDSLAWLSGHWTSEVDGVESEEYWLQPRGGLMLGLHRDVRPSGSAFFEWLRIEERPDGIFYIASPAGGSSTQFELVEFAEQRAVFENDAHDWPQRIIYWVDSDGALHGRAAGKQDGVERVAEWILRPAGR